MFFRLPGFGSIIVVTSRLATPFLACQGIISLWRLKTPDMEVTYRQVRVPHPATAYTCVRVRSHYSGCFSES